MTAVKVDIAWIGLDVPVEILSVAGSPRRLDADASTPSADVALFGEGGGHPWMRAVTGALLAQNPPAARLVIGATPVTGVWLYNFLLTLSRGKGAPALPSLELVNLSHGARPSAVRFNRASFARLADRLGANKDAIRSATTARNAVRAMQRRIEALRHGPDRRLSGSQARRLLDGADHRSAEDFLAWAEAAIASTRRAAAPGDSLPVIYSGPGSPSLDVYTALEERGICVVGDDCDYGSRAIGPDVELTADPLAALADRYALRSPAPAGWSTRDRIQWLTDLVADRRARAVIFDMPPWAHPAAWDFPAERRALEARGAACIVAPDAAPAAQAEAVAAALRAQGFMSAIHA